MPQGTATAVDDTLRASTRLIEAKAREAEAGAAASVVAAVVHGKDKEPQPTQQLDQSGRILDVANGVIEMQGKQVAVAQEEAAKAKAQNDQQFQAGYQEAEERGHFFIEMLDRSHQREIEARDHATAMIEQVRTDTRAVVDDLKGKIDTLIVAQKDGEIATLKAELERLKGGGAANGAAANGHAAVPIVGFKPIALPDGRVVYVQENPSAATSGKAAFASLKEQLAEVAEITDALDRIRGPKAPVNDMTNPDIRWRHSQIDWEERARTREQDRLDRIANAQVEREQSLTRAIEAIPEVVKKHGGKVATAIVGGAPDRGAYNGMPDRPPVARRQVPPAPAAQPEQPPQGSPPPQAEQGFDDDLPPPPGGVEV